MGLLPTQSKAHRKPATSQSEILLCIIDWQKFFIHPTSPGFISGAPAAKEKIVQLVRGFLDAGLPVIATRHSNSPADPSSFLRFYGRVITPDSRWFELAPPLNRVNRLIVFDKHAYSVFENKGITSFVATIKARRMVLAGVQTDKCVLASALAGFDRGLEMIVLSNACCSRNRYRHRAALNLMKSSCAAVMEVDKFIKMIKK